MVRMSMICVCIASYFGYPASTSAESYDLVEPSGVVTGHIDIFPGRLIVQDHSGEQVYFSRDPGYDTRGGGYAGYFNDSLSRILRFPKDSLLAVPEE